MRKVRFPASLAFTASLLLSADALILRAAAPARTARASKQRYIGDVKFLASDERRGRGAGSPELEEAGRYIEQAFRKAGLQPGNGTSYLQPLEVSTGAEMGPKNTLTLRSGGEEIQFKVGVDYLPINFSSAGEVSGPLVFAGYGITADEFGYDDYFHLDVKNKIVVVLRYEPPEFGKRLGYEGRRYTRHSHLIAKAINARNRGAKALIVVNGNRDGKEDELLKFGSVSGPADAGILVLHGKNALVDAWLKTKDTSLEKLQSEIDKEFSPSSFSFPATLELAASVDIERKRATVNNIIGYLPGRTDEYVIIGAHYDHLGLGDQSSLAPSQIGEIHHGADDNASGTAGLIELARLFTERRDSLERGVLFMAFSGEEIGLLGSAYWAEHPTLPLEKAAAMINMDMIGRINNSKVYIGGVGTGSTLKPIVEAIAKSSGFKVDYSDSGYSSSDHTSFVAKKIPVLFFFSGLHSDYHKPSDTWEKINGDSAAKLLDLISDVAANLIAADQRPEFVPVKSEKGVGGHSGDGGGGGGYGPYFGSVPDFGENEFGVKFADVRPDSPAGKAGLKGGDILTQFGDKPIKNLYDFTYALRDSKVGDTVEVKVLRGGETVTAKVTLEQRK